MSAIGIKCKTASDMNWEKLENGKLLSAASQAGFSCILTKDFLFAESAAKSMDKFPQMGIVLITLPQDKGELYAKNDPLAPLSGKAPSFE